MTGPRTPDCQLLIIFIQVMKELEKRKNQRREEGINLDKTGPSDWSVQNTPKADNGREPKNRGEAIDDYLDKKEKRRQFLLTPSAKIPRVGQNSDSIKKSGSKRAATPRKNTTNQKRQLAFEAIKVDESEKALDDVMEEDETENPSLMELPKTPAKAGTKTPTKKTPAKTPAKSSSKTPVKTPRSRTPSRKKDDVTMTSETDKSDVPPNDDMELDDKQAKTPGRSKTPARSKPPARAKTPSRRNTEMTSEPENLDVRPNDETEPEKKPAKTPVKTRSKTPAKTPSKTPTKTPSKTPVASGTATKTPSKNTRKSVTNPKKDLNLDQNNADGDDVMKPGGVSLRKRNPGTKSEDGEIQFKSKTKKNVPQTPLPHKFPDPKAASTPRFQFGKKSISKNDDKPFVFGGNSTGNKSKLGEKSIQSKSPSIELGEQKFKNARERALAYAKKVANRNNRRLGVKGMTKAKQRAKIANKENN